MRKKQSALDPIRVRELKGDEGKGEWMEREWREKMKQFMNTLGVDDK